MRAVSTSCRRTVVTCSDWPEHGAGTGGGRNARERPDAGGHGVLAGRSTDDQPQLRRGGQRRAGDSARPRFGAGSQVRDAEFERAVFDAGDSHPDDEIGHQPGARVDLRDGAQQLLWDCEGASKPGKLRGSAPGPQQFGGSVGGPIVLPKLYYGRNKSFFFVAYERFSLRQAANELVTVPTVPMRTGDFSGLVNGAGIQQTLYDPSTTGSAAENSVRAPFPNNQIPITRSARWPRHCTPQRRCRSPTTTPS